MRVGCMIHKSWKAIFRVSLTSLQMTDLEDVEILLVGTPGLTYNSY